MLEGGKTVEKVVSFGSDITPYVSQISHWSTSSDTNSDFTFDAHWTVSFK